MKLIDITGQSFGRLRVLRKAAKPCMWECQCSCGVIKLYDGTNLRSGNTTSCGCVHKEKLIAINQSRAKDPWLADMTIYKRRLHYRKGRRGIGSNQFHEILGIPISEHPSFQWGLSLSEYTGLVTSPCFYCGCLPHQEPYGVLAKKQGLKRNGIDRVDNSKGYFSDNCVSCCTACNREKRGQSLEQFIDNTRRRYEHLKSTGWL